MEVQEIFDLIFTLENHAFHCRSRDYDITKVWKSPEADRLQSAAKMLEKQAKAKFGRNCFKGLRASDIRLMK